jgi:hypothetical protein
MKTCSKCGITLRGRDQEGDICLTCLSSLTPHCNFDQGYSTIEGCIRQTTNNPIKRNMIEETMHYIFITYFKDKLKNNEYHKHKYFPLYLSLQHLLEEYNNNQE